MTHNKFAHTLSVILICVAGIAIYFVTQIFDVNQNVSPLDEALRQAVGSTDFTLRRIEGNNEIAVTGTTAILVYNESTKTYTYRSSYGGDYPILIYNTFDNAYVDVIEEELHKMKVTGSYRLTQMSNNLCTLRNINTGEVININVYVKDD